MEIDMEYERLLPRGEVADEPEARRRRRTQLDKNAAGTPESNVIRGAFGEEHQRPEARSRERKNAVGTPEKSPEYFAIYGADQPGDARGGRVEDSRRDREGELGTREGREVRERGFHKEGGGRRGDAAGKVSVEIKEVHARHVSTGAADLGRAPVWGAAWDIDRYYGELETKVFDSEDEYLRFVRHVFEQYAGEGLEFTDRPIQWSVRASPWLLERVEGDFQMRDPVDDDLEPARQR
ncbi:MAG: hypothetical protein ACREA0_17495, partial [bacterium]